MYNSMHSLSYSEVQITLGVSTYMYTVSHVSLLCSHAGQQNLFLGRVTPDGLIIINLPEKLVLEVESSGGYARLGWTRNHVGFSFAPDAEFPATTDRFINFYEIYVRDPTDTSDLGEYEVGVVSANFAQNYPGDVIFTVVPYGKLQHGCCQHRVVTYLYYPSMQLSPLPLLMKE